MDMPSEPSPGDFVVPRLNKLQRRLLGTLIEKACTTPEYYPMTLKALTAGCNQKNNRDPVTNYQEDDVETGMEQLQKTKLTATVHTSGGRTERYRHLLRQVLTISEGQLAILGELLLRGRQQMGELRARASRMRPIETQEQLKSELEGLMALGLVTSDADLARRGTLVDHLLYPEQEGVTLTRRPPSTSDADDIDGEADSPHSSPPAASSGASKAFLAEEIKQLQEDNQQLRMQIDQLERKIRSIEDAVDRLRRDLGVI